MYDTQLVRHFGTRNRKEKIRHNESVSSWHQVSFLITALQCNCACLNVLFRCVFFGHHFDIFSSLLFSVSKWRRGDLCWGNVGDNTREIEAPSPLKIVFLWPCRFEIWRKVPFSKDFFIISNETCCDFENSDSVTVFRRFSKLRQRKTKDQRSWGVRCMRNSKVPW